MELKTFLVVNLLAIFHLIDCNDGETSSAPPTDQLNCNQSTWDRNILDHCCNIPDPIHERMQLESLHKCQNSTKIDCVIFDYVRLTHLLDQYNEIDKESVKLMYEKNKRDPIWKDVIEKAIENCIYEKTDNISENFRKYYSCIGNYLTVNCVSFLPSKLCENVSERADLCREIVDDCKFLTPNSIKSCCNVPRLIATDSVEKCKHNCQRKEILVKKREICEGFCTLNETGILMDGKFNFINVKRNLMMGANNSVKWEKSIDITIQYLEPQFKGENFSFYR